jgi:GNAT superfamily N-acetyltransferase
MEIRKANSSDTPAIVALLRLGLGEVALSKTETFWSWKHEENPFGRSEVLLAYQDDTLLGVRAFMRWNWTSGARAFHALRAVDTVVHPEYQGQGIFKKLTTTLRDQCRTDGYDFIFNTPNAQSRPGYLKMGWMDLGRVRVRIRPVLSIARKSNTPEGMDIMTAVMNYTPVQTEAGAQLWTAKTREYLFWRYVRCPALQYFGYTHPQEGWLLVVCPRTRGRSRELRITEWLPGTQPPTRKAMQEVMQSCIRAFKPDYFAISPGIDIALRRHLPVLGFLPSVAAGPRLTYYPLRTSMPPVQNVADFSYTFGDLELF